MPGDKKPITIKKYANRRLYNTGTSAYVTLEDLALMVKAGEDFLVYDAKSGDDITRSVLAQIIFEQEGKVGQSLLPIAFLRQLIRLYGDSMQMLVPSYLEFSLDKLTRDGGKMRDQLQTAFGETTVPGAVFEAIEEQTRKNMQMFSQALGLFNPFAATGAAGAVPPTAPAPVRETTDLEALKKQMSDMQKQLEGLARKG